MSGELDVTGMVPNNALLANDRKVSQAGKRKRLSEREIEQRGEAIYEEKIRPFVETEANIGKYLVVDIDSYEWEMDINPLIPTKRALEKRPEARLYGVRVGFDVEFEVKSAR